MKLEAFINGYLNTVTHEDPEIPLSSWDSLTHREREIIKLIAEGYRSKEIAEYLTISSNTVDKHRSNLMKKLDLHNIGSLTNYAIQNGLLKTSQGDMLPVSNYFFQNT